MKTTLRIAAFLLAAASGVALAQSTERPKPPGTQPLEDLPPPPALPPVSPGDAKGIEGQPLQPQVTTRKEGPNTIEEYRVHGRLYMMKVTPAHGHPYILRDDNGDGSFIRQPLDQGVRVPQWVLWEW
jgi:hypothetical protein